MKRAHAVVGDFLFWLFLIKAGVVAVDGIPWIIYAGVNINVDLSVTHAHSYSRQKWFKSANIKTEIMAVIQLPLLIYFAHNLCFVVVIVLHICMSITVCVSIVPIIYYNDGDCATSHALRYIGNRWPHQYLQFDTCNDIWQLWNIALDGEWDRKLKMCAI